jgi:hypothetical protein
MFGFACSPHESRRDSALTTRVGANATCPRPANGIVVGFDTIALFATKSTMAELIRRCPAGDTTMYDAVGFQAMARTFPFTGARITAVQTGQAIYESIDSTKPADLWTAEGDSLRLPDGLPVPHTLGEIRARYGKTIVDENFVDADDFDGPGARACRFPRILFALAINDTARKVADSARVVRLEVSTTDTTKTTERFCAEHVRD